LVSHQRLRLHSQIAACAIKRYGFIYGFTFYSDIVSDRHDNREQCMHRVDLIRFSDQTSIYSNNVFLVQLKPPHRDREENSSGIVWTNSVHTTFDSAFHQAASESTCTCTCTCAMCMHMRMHMCNVHAHAHAHAHVQHVHVACDMCRPVSTQSAHIVPRQRHRYTAAQHRQRPGDQREPSGRAAEGGADAELVAQAQVDQRGQYEGERHLGGIRLQAGLHTAAARIAYGCSREYVRLQPGPHSVAASTTKH
jgi:hypothetical protein